MPAVLVVEDDEQVLVLAQAILQENGFETFSAHASEGALALLADQDQTIDLLFTDIRLFENRHGGIQLAREAVQLRPGIRVLYTSGQAVTDGMAALFIENS